MLQNLTGWHAILILVVVLLVFGASKLPALAKSVGQSVKILKDEIADGERAAGSSSMSRDGASAANDDAPRAPQQTSS